MIIVRRPERCDGVDRITATALREAVLGFAVDERLRVAVFTSGGDN